MKRIVHSLRYIWPAVVLVLGIGFVLNPYIDGASEIFCPTISQGLWLALSVWQLIALMAFIADCACFILAFFHRWSSFAKAVTATPLVLLPVLWMLVYPPGITWTDRRISAFPIGGRMRVMWAGGPSKVREEALAFLATSQDSTPPESEWPASIRALGAGYVKIDQSTRVVQVNIPRRNVFADQFSFLIQSTDAPAPRANDKSGGHGHRIWELAEGIYLYEEW